MGSFRQLAATEECWKIRRFRAGAGKLDGRAAGVPQWRHRLIELIAESEQVGADAFREALSGRMVRMVEELRRNPGPRGFMGMRGLIDTALGELRASP